MYYEPLTHDISFESVTSSIFSPLKTSSIRLKLQSTTINNSTNKSRTHSSNIFNLSEKRNLRILSVNCRSIKDKTSEFSAAVTYITPDIINGTESWLKGEKHGENPTKDAIKSSEVFPKGFTGYRNDRGTLGGGVFILVRNEIISVEQPDLVTNWEIIWVEIQLKGKKKLLIGSFYMPHRNMNCVEELEKSLNMTVQRNKNIMLTGDFNCPDINRETMAVNANASDRAVQTKIMDLTIQFQLSQIHETPKRENNLFRHRPHDNPISCQNFQKCTRHIRSRNGSNRLIQNHTINTANQENVNIYSKANWEKLKEDMDKTSVKI
jgi:hypothetical protein